MELLLGHTLEGIIRESLAVWIGGGLDIALLGRLELDSSGGKLLITPLDGAVCNKFALGCGTDDPDTLEYIDDGVDWFNDELLDTALLDVSDGVVATDAVDCC